MHNAISLSREDFELVLAVAEEGTLTRAAARLHLSQSALSHHLRSLEDTLSRSLFRRGSRGMAPTELGTAMVEGARRVCGEFQRSEEILATLARGSRRVIRLATECYTSYNWLPRVVREMTRIAPDIELRLVIEATQRAKAALENGEADAVILQSAGINPSYVYWPLLRDEIVLLVSKGHPYAKRRAVEPLDLSTETLLLHQVPGRKHAVIDEFLLPAKVYPREIREVQLTEAIVEMVRAGLGSAALARWVVAPQVKDGRICCVRLGKKGLWRDWRLATVRNHLLRPQIEQLARVFSSLIRGRVGARWS